MQKIKNKELVLPRVFKDMSEDKKYSKWEGMPKLSYSQLTSWRTPIYKPQYIRSYFCGIPDPGNVFTEYGSAVGTWVEAVGTGCDKCHEPYTHLLTDTTREFLSQGLDYPEQSKYEDYIVINVDDRYVIEGYIDRSVYLPEKRIIIEDFKTGSITKKAAEYASPDYNQTRLYAYAKETEGYHIEDCRVVLLDRKGNGSVKSPITLTGKLKIIPTPYSREETELFLKAATETVEEISEHYQKYLKLFK